MEQQVISVAKGGIVCKINTRTTIVAACNFIQSKRYSEDLAIATGIISSLLSRFDLIYLLPDEHDKDEDIATANYCLFKNSVLFKSNKSIWSPEKMNKYIKLVQSIFNPYITEEAEEIFKAYFRYIKHSCLVGKERKTVRMLESIIRLGQAHARLMFRNEVTTFDAISIILLTESSLASGLMKENYPHARYTNDRDYFELKVEILQRLNLVEKHHEILWKNMKRDIAERNRTPSPVNEYIEDTEINNMMASEMLSEDFSHVSTTFTNPLSLNITQVEIGRKYQKLLPEETKIMETSQKIPTVDEIELDEED